MDSAAFSRETTACWLAKLTAAGVPVAEIRDYASVVADPQFEGRAAFLDVASPRRPGERVRIVLPEEINTYDVLLCDHIVFSTATLATTVARLGSGTAEEA